MIYEMYKARNMFNYLFLSRAISSCLNLSTDLWIFSNNELNLLKSTDRINLISAIENFATFNDLISRFVNTDEIRMKIGELSSKFTIDQEYCVPLLVPIK